MENLNDLKLLENELVSVYETSTGEKVVYGTELHKVLGVKSNYTTWAQRRLNDCDAVENEDYETCFPKLESEMHGGKNKKDHIIKLDTAKEMAMLERNDKGKQVRRYFIEVEKRYKELKAELSKENQLILTIINSNDKLNRVTALSEYKQIITAPLLETIDTQSKTIDTQNNQLQKQKPFVEAALQIQKTEDYKLIREAAKLLCNDGIKVGEKKLFALLREHDILMGNNEPYQRYINLGLFVIKLNIIDTKYGTVKTKNVTLVTGKGLILLNKKVREWLGMEASDVAM